MMGVVFSVILTILKIIGIIILLILGLALLIICMVLFVPVRCKSKGHIRTEDACLEGEVRVTWLLHLLSIRVWFVNEKVHYYGRLLGIKIINSDKIKSKPDKEQTDKPRAQSEENLKLEKLPETESADKADSSVTDNNHSRDTTSMDKLYQPQQRDADSTVNESQEQPEEKKKFRQKFSEKINNIKFKFISICDKIRNVNGVKNSYVEFLTADASRIAIRDIKTRIFKILCHIKPTKLTIKASFGFPDPAATGQVYGGLSVLLNRYGSTIVIEPQFVEVEKSFAEGSFKLRGRIRLVVLVFHAIKIYTNKRLKEFMTFVKG